AGERLGRLGEARVVADADARPLERAGERVAQADLPSDRVLDPPSILAADEEAAARRDVPVEVGADGEREAAVLVVEVRVDVAAREAVHRAQRPAMPAGEVFA